MPLTREVYDGYMRLTEGDNHLISARDGLIVCQVWTRPDLSPEDGARNARDMVAYLIRTALFAGSPYRGLIFDVRRGPAIFGPKTRETLAGLLEHARKARVPVAMLAGATPVQVVQFQNLCAESRAESKVFSSESEAIGWFGRRQPGYMMR
jgi:hypothetical protein